MHFPSTQQLQQLRRAPGWGRLSACPAGEVRGGEGHPAPCLGLVGRRHSSTSGFCICSATCWSGIQSWPSPGEGRVPLSSPRVGAEVWAACKASLFSQGTRLPGFAKLPCGGKDQPIRRAHYLGSGVAGIQDLEGHLHQQRPLQVQNSFRLSLEDTPVSPPASPQG